MEKRIRYLTTDEKMTENIQKRIKQLIRAIGEGIWEKERILAMGVLCGISEESLFLLGPPGTGKSMVARRLKEIFAGGTSFEYLMSRFSTPDEIFGRTRTATSAAQTGICRLLMSFSWTRYGRPALRFRMPC